MLVIKTEDNSDKNKDIILKSNHIQYYHYSDTEFLHSNIDTGTNGRLLGNPL